MVSSMAWTLFKWLAIISLVIFVLYNLFTDPAGSAAWLSSVIHGIITGVKALITFATNIHG